jgi:hypothetical protein
METFREIAQIPSISAAELLNDSNDILQLSLNQKDHSNNKKLAFKSIFSLNGNQSQSLDHQTESGNHLKATFVNQIPISNDVLYTVSKDTITFTVLKGNEPNTCIGYMFENHVLKSVVPLKTPSIYSDGN